MITRKKAAKKRSTKKRAAATRNTAKKKAATKRPKATAPAVGTTIERAFKGEAYRLRVTADGFVLGKETFRSLTAAAKAVTKYPSVSGVRFWLGTGTEKGGTK